MSYLIHEDWLIDEEDHNNKEKGIKKKNKKQTTDPSYTGTHHTPDLSAAMSGLHWSFVFCFFLPFFPRMRLLLWHSLSIMKTQSQLNCVSSQFILRCIFLQQRVYRINTSDFRCIQMAEFHDGCSEFRSNASKRLFVSDVGLSLKPTIGLF